MQSISDEVYKSKYQLKTNKGALIDKDRDATYCRVAKALSDVEDVSVRKKWYNKFLYALRNGAIPAGRVISNAGAENYKPNTSLINCIASNTIKDSISGIMDSCTRAAKTLSGGSGIGYDFSTLRPKGAYVDGVGATTSGSLSFMNIFDSMCFTIASAGGRRGAMMSTFDISHPDIEDYITAKREDGKLRQFNMSVMVTDEFMEAVKNNDDWQLIFPIHKNEYDEASEYVWKHIHNTEEYHFTSSDGRVAHKIYKKVRAVDLYDKIMQNTYDYSEPGILFIDNINTYNPLHTHEHISITNPCGRVR